jgi:triacylglycerol lipase
MNNPQSVVLVHGIFHFYNIFRKMSKFLEKQGFRTFAPSLSPSTGKIGLDELARQLKTYIDENIPVGETFYLVGFSMGGLICRYYLQRLDGIKRVKRFISLSAPHSGTRMAYLLKNAGCRQMRPGSEFLKDLNSDVKRLEEMKVVSIWTPFDLSIRPAKSSHLPLGEELTFPVLLHPLMVRDKRVLRAIGHFLKE